MHSAKAWISELQHNSQQHTGRPTTGSLVASVTTQWRARTATTRVPSHAVLNNICRYLLQSSNMSRSCTRLHCCRAEGNQPLCSVSNGLRQGCMYGTHGLPHSFKCTHGCHTASNVHMSACQIITHQCADSAQYIQAERTSSAA